MVASSFRHNIVLIGMPASGKSTLGILLAKKLGWAFIDTDIVIQTREGGTLKEIIAVRGMTVFKRLEERYVCELEVERTVIATGGSVVYSPAAMHHLRWLGTVVWLDLALEILEKRLGNLRDRGVVMEPGQGLAELFVERCALYRRYCHHRIICDGLSHEQAVDAIVAALRPHPGR